MTSYRPSSSTKVKIPWSFEQRAIIPLRDNIFWKIEKGIARTCGLLEDGNIITFGLWGKDDIVGKALMGVNPYRIECLTSVKAQPFISSESQVIAQAALAHLTQLEELTIIRSYKRVESMMLKLLGWLGEKFGQEVTAGRLIDLRLTHQDLGDILGITRVTVTRILKQLEQQGFIERLSLKQIIIKEVDFWYYEI